MKLRAWLWILSGIAGFLLLLWMVVFKIVASPPLSLFSPFPVVSPRQNGRRKSPQFPRQPTPSAANLGTNLVAHPMSVAMQKVTEAMKQQLRARMRYLDYNLGLIANLHGTELETAFVRGRRPYLST